MKTNSIRAITVNQVGYPVYARKIAYFVNEGGAFEVVDTLKGAVVFRGETGAPVEDAASGSYCLSRRFLCREQARGVSGSA